MTDRTDDDCEAAGCRAKATVKRTVPYGRGRTAELAFCDDHDPQSGEGLSNLQKK